MERQNTTIESIGSWIKNSITLKLIAVTILMLLMLIPTSMIKSIISEREILSEEATNSVSSKWAESQTINGPILTVPIQYEIEEYSKKKLVTEYYHILPDELEINGIVNPKRLKRGIYEVIVYTSDLKVIGNFDLEQLSIHNDPTKGVLKQIQYDQAFLTIGISDLKGIKDRIVVNWNNNQQKTKSGSAIPTIIPSGVTIDLPNIDGSPDAFSHFNFNLALQGSKNISFVPLGNETKVKLTSDWNSPSFNGNFLPDARDVSDTGFNASWKILQLNRNIPQTWYGLSQSIDMNATAFGVDLILPIDDYQKSVRSSKYAVMTIALTFLIFFLVEILNKRKIHPFQYALVGLGLSLFYVLLVSISEHSNFNIAYGIAASSIICMITLYANSVFKSKKSTMLLFGTLIGIYGFLFVTVQLADYALLMGSIGLTLILSLTMYFTRKIDWYELNTSK